MPTHRIASSCLICLALVPFMAKAACEIQLMHFSKSLTSTGLAARNKYFVEQCTRANGELLDATDPTLRGRLLPPSNLIPPKNTEDYYPDEALQLGYIGEVLLACVVEADGSIQDVAVIERSPHEKLNRAAVLYYRNSRYQTPAMLDGRPVRVLTYQRARFRLWHR